MTGRGGEKERGVFVRKEGETVDQSCRRSAGLAGSAAARLALFQPSAAGERDFAGINRRIFLAGAAIASAWPSSASATDPLAWRLADATHPADGEGASAKLTPSGPVASQFDGQIIENLDIETSSGSGVKVGHRNVTVRRCRIRHAGGHGVEASNAPAVVIRDCDIDHVGAPAIGAGPASQWNNVHLEDCPGAVLGRIKASRGAANVYAQDCPGAKLRFLELYDARGPEPRGQNVQLNRSSDSTLEDFSAENGPTSWTEDNISIFSSDRCAVRRGLVSYNNSPTGDGVMIEGGFDCRVEDVDALMQGNGAFAAVPLKGAGGGGCAFIRCRTRDSYNTPRDGRDAPSSDGLSIYVRISSGAPKHTIEDCQYDSLANLHNLIWDLRAVNPGWSFVRRPFTPRPPIRLAFGW